MSLSRSLVALAAAATLAVAGCGSSADEATAPDNTTKVTGDLGGEINVWTWEGAPGTEAMTRLAAGFRSKTGVKVTSKVIKRDDYKAQTSPNTDTTRI